MLPGCVVISHVTWISGHVICYLVKRSCHVLHVPGYAVCHVLVVTWIFGHVTCYLDVWKIHMLPGSVVMSHVTWMRGNVKCYLDVR